MSSHPRHGPGKIVNRHELAAIFAVVPSTINKWQELGMPVKVKGRRGVPDQFDSADCLWWRHDYEVAQHEAAAAGDDGSPKARLLKAKAQLAELKLQRTLDSVVPVDLWVETQDKLFVFIRRTLVRHNEAYAHRLAPETDGRVCEKILEEMVEAIRADLLSGMAEQRWKETS